MQGCRNVGRARGGGGSFFKGPFNAVRKVIKPTLRLNTVKTLKQNHSTEYVAYTLKNSNKQIINKKLSKGHWWFGSNAPKCRRQGSLGTEPPALGDFAIFLQI